MSNPNPSNAFCSAPAFPVVSGRLRLAATALPTHPTPGHEHALTTADRLADLLSAETAWFHWRVPDPGSLPATLRPWLGAGMFLPAWDTSRREDEAHFAATEPDRHRRLLELLAPLRADGEAQNVGFDVGMAWSMARWAKAWRADVALSFYPHTGSLAAAVAGALLEIPHAVWLGTLTPETKLPWHFPAVLSLASVVSVADQASLAVLATRFGTALAAKAVARTEPGAMALLARRLQDAVVARPANAPQRGPEPAFATRIEAAQPAEGARLFAIACAERTGSNLLVDLLARQPRVACVGELFNSRFLDGGKLPWLDTAVPHADELRHLRTENPSALLARLRLEAQQRGFDQVGLKVMYGHLVTNNALVDALLAAPDLRIVHLRREDRLGRLLSYLRAKETDVWFRRKGSGEAAAPRVTLTAEQMAQDFALQEAFERRCAATFAGHPSIDITYEELVQDQQQVLERLAHLLGMRARDVAPLLRKEAPKDPAAGVVGWHDLRTAFTGTRWACQFPGEPASEGPRPDDRAAESP